jgi:hypothetical protein
MPVIRITWTGEGTKSTQDLPIGDNTFSTGEAAEDFGIEFAKAWIDKNLIDSLRMDRELDGVEARVQNLVLSPEIRTPRQPIAPKLCGTGRTAKSEKRDALGSRAHAGPRRWGFLFADGSGRLRFRG